MPLNFEEVLYTSPLSLRTKERGEVGLQGIKIYCLPNHPESNNWDPPQIDNKMPPTGPSF